MKMVNSIIFLVLIFFVVLILFTFLDKKNSLIVKNIGQDISCYSKKIDNSILNLSSKLKFVNAFISFKNLPLNDKIKNNLNQLDIKLDEKSVTFDYIWSEIPIGNLCDLIKLEEVKSIFTFNNK
jgi:hypothetical protein